MPNLFVVTDQPNLTALTGAVLRGRTSAVKRTAAIEAIRNANPLLDFERLRPGAVVIIVSGVTVSSVNLATAGLASRLPAASLARTLKVWAPSARPLKVRGDAQAAKAAESRLHSSAAAGKQSSK